MKTEVEKILLNVINDFNSKWKSHDEKDAGVFRYAEQIVKLFSQADVSGQFVCKECNKNKEEWMNGICEDCTLKGFTEQTNCH